jgi:hypothetical protein
MSYYVPVGGTPGAVGQPSMRYCAGLTGKAGWDATRQIKFDKGQIRYTMGGQPVLSKWASTYYSGSKGSVDAKALGEIAACLGNAFMWERMPGGFAMWNAIYMVLRAMHYWATQSVDGTPAPDFSQNPVFMAMASAAQESGK